MSDPLVDACAELVRNLEATPLRPELELTPARVADAWRELTSGYGKEPRRIAEKGVFLSPESGLVVVRDISLCSVCEHHLLPFIGTCHVGYLPAGKLIGISKIARVVDAFARRLQVQERLGEQIADVLEETLQPQGLAVIIEAKHLCMIARGIRQEKASVRTAVLRGVFLSDPTSQEHLWRTLG